MSTKTIIALASVALIGACAHPSVFEIPSGGDEVQFHRDNFECAVEAKNLVGDQLVIGSPMMIAIAAASRNQTALAAHDECMLGKGYILKQRGHV